MSPKACCRAGVAVRAAATACGGARGGRVEPAMDVIHRCFKGRADGSIGADDRPAS
jgi:hypothetical protein